MLAGCSLQIWSGPWSLRLPFKDRLRFMLRLRFATGLFHSRNSSRVECFIFTHIHFPSMNYLYLLKDFVDIIEIETHSCNTHFRLWKPSLMRKNDWTIRMFIQSAVKMFPCQLNIAWWYISVYGNRTNGSVHQTPPTGGRQNVDRNNICWRGNLNILDIPGKCPRKTFENAIWKRPWSLSIKKCPLLFFTTYTKTYLLHGSPRNVPKAPIL